ncbi:MAG: tyrosine--tRNA ligase [Planctomycetia bacterium]
MLQDPALAQALAPLARCVEAAFPERELLARLRAGRPLRCKLGLDPTSSSVHVGNAVVLWNLRRLQDLGHQAVLIVGDYTATVGDPSGKDKTRPMLTPEQVEQNLATWMTQMGRILDMGRVEVRRNSEWFSRMGFLEVLALTDRMTVQQMMERDNFAKRWKEQAPISVREFLYCLMQGWDSVMVDADVELGGTDQTFNLTVGRRLMEQVGKPPQSTLISPLLQGLDGHEKMSKSLGNAIGLDETPKDMFGKAMRVSDTLCPAYMRLATDLPGERITQLLAGHPMEAKLSMAEALVARYHGAAAGTAAREEFRRVFSADEVPTDLAEVDAGPAGEDGRWWIVDLLRRAGFAASTSEARRLVESKGVQVEGRVVADWQERLALQGGELLRAGRRRQARLARR